MSKLHYFLITGQIMFKDNSLPEQVSVNAVNTNAVMTSSQSTIPARGIAKAQQASQQAFIQRMDGLENINILDVIIMNIVYLGEFTQEDFQAPPAGVQVQEVVRDIDGVIDILNGAVVPTNKVQ